MSLAVRSPFQQHRREAFAAFNGGDTARAYTLFVALADTYWDNKSAIEESVSVLTHIGHADEAIAILQRTMMRVGDSPLLLTRLITLFTSLQRWREAADAARKLRAITPDSAFARDSLGAALLACGRLDEAEELLAASLEETPEAISSYVNYCLLLVKRRQFIDALSVIDRAIRVDENSRAAHRMRALLLTEMNQPVLAARAFRRALAIDPNDADSLMGLANLEAARTNYTAAIELAKKTLAQKPAHVMATHLLASWSGSRTSKDPVGYARLLFDMQADTFDHRMVHEQYRVPRDTVTLLRTLTPARDSFKTLLDMGCGTGLGTAALAEDYNIPNRVGMDVSPNMLGIAAQKQLYTQLTEGNIDAVLAGTSDTFDLIMALDVLAYVGPPERLFAAVASRLSPNGLFAYSIETCIDDDVTLARSGRHQHAMAYVNGIAAACGLSPAISAGVILRTVERTRMPGYICVVKRS